MDKGKISYNSLIRSVLRVPFERKETDHIGRDGAYLTRETGAVTNTTVYGGKYAAELAFYRTYNGALSAGIEPENMLLSLTFPEKTKESRVKAYMEAFESLAKREKTAISGGHTAFSGAITTPVLTVTIMGKSGAETRRKALPGDEVIVTGFAGDTGAAILLSEDGDTLRTRFSDDFLESMNEYYGHLSVRPVYDALSGIPCYMHDVSEGGVFGALFELAEGNKCGFTVERQLIPVHQETVECCNHVDWNPYGLLSTGCMLIAVSDGEEAMRRLWEAGITAAAIGKIEEGSGKLLLRGGETGYLERPKMDEIMKLKTFG